MAVAPIERFPADLKVTLEDFLSSGWKEALASINQQYYFSMWSALSNAAQKAMTAGKTANGKVLWLLADACSLELKPDSINEPFRARVNNPTGRSAIPEDFDSNVIDLFAEALGHVDDLMLKARLADVVWLMQKPRDVQYAHVAIDTYRNMPFDTESWTRDIAICHRRGVRLAIALGRGGGERLIEMEAAIVAAIETAKTDDGYLAFWLAELLRDTRLGRSDCLKIAEKIESLGTAFDKANDLHRSRDYFDCAAQWYEAVKNEIKAAEMFRNGAESWVKEAQARSSGATPSFMASAHFLQCAIHAYRRIPAKRRVDLKVNERLEELHKMMTEASQRSVGEMGVIQLPPMDITEMVERSYKILAGKELHEALMIFADIRGPLIYKNIRNSVRDLMKQHVLSSLFAATTMSRDGRVIARRPPASFGDLEDDDPALWAEVVKHYAMETDLIVRGMIWPAQETILFEHRIRLSDIINIARQSPLVPPGRDVFIAKGVYAGFEHDFTSAIHLLTPQVEHAVRWQLKLREIKTTVIDSFGIETEVGLSALLDKPEVKQIFGEDITFELAALFTDPFGPNLRNEVAHGLMEQGGGDSTYAVYAWWWFFSLVFKTFINQVRKSAGTDWEPVDRDEK